MQFQHYDLGYRSGGDHVRVDLEGTEANVQLVDAANFAAYRARRSYRYYGGHTRTSPVLITVPRAAHWYVVIDLGGYAGQVRTSVQVI